MNAITSELFEIYQGTNKEALLSKFLTAQVENDSKRIQELRSRLKTKDELFKELLERLKGKPVEKTLQRIYKGKTDNIYETLKGLFSLGTHIAIECEKGSYEYRVLLRDLYVRIGDLLKRL